MPSLWEDNGVLLERDGVLIEGTSGECCTCAGNPCCDSCTACLPGTCDSGGLSITFTGVVGADPCGCDDWNDTFCLLHICHSGCDFGGYDPDGGGAPGVIEACLVLPCDGSITVLIWIVGGETKVWVETKEGMATGGEWGGIGGDWVVDGAGAQVDCESLGAGTGLDAPGASDCDWSSATVSLGASCTYVDDCP